MKHLVTTIWILLAALCFASRPPTVVPDELAAANWILLSTSPSGQKTETHIDRKCVEALIEILNSHAKASRPVSPQPPGPPPSAAPDLVIEIRNKDGKHLAQILGFNRNLIGFREFGISDKTIVSKFYETTKPAPDKPEHRTPDPSQIHRQ